MIGEIAEVRSAGAGGLALGLLDARGRVDVDALRPLVVAAGPLPVTFHRAFDEVADPLGALDDLVALGVARVLTGGGPGTAWEGRALLRELVRRGGDRITVVAGGRVRAGHAAALVAATGVRELHARAEAFPALAAAVHGVDHRA
jgi:copper homeostasis protein